MALTSLQNLKRRTIIVKKEAACGMSQEENNTTSHKASHTFNLSRSLEIQSQLRSQVIPPITTSLN